MSRGTYAGAYTAGSTNERPLRGRIGARLVEGVVEIQVQVVGLVGQHRAERAAIGREPAVAGIDVVTIGNRRGNGLLRVDGDPGLDGSAVAPGRRRAAVAKGPQKGLISTSPSRSRPTAVGTGTSLLSTFIKSFISGPAPMTREKTRHPFRKLFLPLL